MKSEKVDIRFALISKDGDVLYPFKKGQRATGRFGFAASAPGERDALGGGEYLQTIEEVISRVVLRGWKVRATTIDKCLKQRHGSFSLNGNVIAGYWVAEELQHLVKGAFIQPSLLPGRQTP